MRRKVTDAQLRDTIVSRKTKGLAFMCTSDEYRRALQAARDEVAGKFRVHLFRDYPEYTYDLR